MHPDEAIAKVAVKQEGAFTLAQAREADLTEKAIRHRCRTGRWSSPYRGVYVLAGTPATRRQRIVVVLLALGATASHLTAAVLLRLTDDDGGTIHVTLAYGKHRDAPRGVRVHQADLRRSDIRRVDNIPVTCPNRTIVDLAFFRNERLLEAGLDNAIQAGLTTVPVLARYIGERGLRRNRGVPMLLRLLEDRSKGVIQKELERMFRRKLRAARLPEPVRQFPVGIRKIDFAYPDKRLAIELDGLGAHFSAAAFREHLRRQNELVLAGWTPLRFSWEDVAELWPTTERTLRDALGTSATSRPPLS